MIERIIAASVRNRFLVFVFTLFAIGAGIYALKQTPLDAIPDLSDAQVIVYTDWEGRSPDLVEDQVTYPISTAFHRRAESEIRPRRIDVRQIVRLRHLSRTARTFTGRVRASSNISTRFAARFPKA